MTAVERSRRLRRAALAYCCVFPVMQIFVVAESVDGGYRWRGVWALAVTAAYLPLHLWHLSHALRLTRPRHAPWTVAAMAVLIVGATPFLNSAWLLSWHALAASALVVLPLRWSAPIVVAVVAAQAPMAAAVDALPVDAGTYYTSSVVWRSAAVLVPVWLVAAIGRLEATRAALAEEAVVRERVRIDDELRPTLGAALGAIVSRGRRASALAAPVAAGAGVADPEPVADELRALVDGSRRALAAARHLINGYQQVSLRAEADIAATLLTAAGIPTRVEAPPEGVAEAVDEHERSALRSATARLLRDRDVRACVITVTRHGDGARVSVRAVADDARPAAREVVAP